MLERPLLLFPAPDKADRERRKAGTTKITLPDEKRQFARLQPSFTVLKAAFEQKKLKIQQSPVGIDPELALVFEVIGSVDNFYTSVKNTEGLEWMFDCETSPFEPDEDFYQKDNRGERTDALLRGKLYCVMSNQQAMTQLLSLWDRYQNGEQNVFKKGMVGLRNVFQHLKGIRKWDARDRIAETRVMEYWHESLHEGFPCKFEIELFYRSSEIKRKRAVETICNENVSLNGRFLQECVISEIFYHCLLVELPVNAIENLVLRYDEIELARIEDIMFFRPTCQSVCVSSGESEICDTKGKEITLTTNDPVVAVFDGMPMQNHRLLRGRVIIDDPDDYATGYESKNRVHGTSMVSLVIHGDLKRNDSPIGSPVYVRPILKPYGFDDKKSERVPDDKLFVDVLHRAVKRMMEGEGDNRPVAPKTRIINLSIGDPDRQLDVTMSPTARLLDFLAYKYNILFIISAGNHPEICDLIDASFGDLKNLNTAQRSKFFGRVLKDNQRSLRVLAPAESLNGLTIGALYDDSSDASENEMLIWAVEKGFPSPISSIGKGYRSTITPDLFYYGGREFLWKKPDGRIGWRNSPCSPGCLSAVPYGTGDKDGQAYSFGTSDAAAQITHEAAKCNEVLNQVFIDSTGSTMPVESTAILLKSMLVHGASWGAIIENLARAMDESPKELSQWLGNGVPDISRVMECTKERVTLIGLGSLNAGEGNVFRFPLPVAFSSRRIKRKLTVTLSYLTPIASNRQTYRGVQLWFSLDERCRYLVPDRQNTDWRAVQRGTLQHEIFTGEKSVVWNEEDFTIKVNCREDACKIKDPIPYCLFVTFEIAEGFGVDLYAKVSARINQRVRIANN